MNRRTIRYRKKGNLLFILCVIAFLIFPFVFNEMVDRLFEGENKTEASSFVEEKKEWSTDTSTKKSPTTEALSPDLYYYYNTLSDEDQRVYDLILDGVYRHESSIFLPMMSVNRLEDVFWMMLYDHPEVFWTDTFQYLSYSDHTELEPIYSYGKKKTDSRMREIEAVADDFSFLLSENDTEYNIIKKVYLYLIDRVQYVSGSSDNQNLYSSLVNRESVCAGYTKATQYLLQKSGIRAIYVSGRAFNRAWGNHGWNIVRCDGQYYHVDTTFGDGLTNHNSELERLGVHDFAYLCVDDETIYRNHSYDGEFPIPACYSNDLNYFVQNGTYANAFDEWVLEDMRASVYSGERVWSYQFSNYEAYAACLRYIDEGGYGTVVRDYLSDTRQTRYIYNDKMFYVMCWY